MLLWRNLRMYLSVRELAGGVNGRRSPSFTLAEIQDTMIFHRVHKAIEEVCSVFDPAIKHFILADSEEQERTRTVVFAIFTSRFEFFGACHWDSCPPRYGIFWTCVVARKGGLSITTTSGSKHHKVSVHQGDLFACYERWGQ